MHEMRLQPLDYTLQAAFLHVQLHRCLTCIAVWINMSLISQMNMTCNENLKEADTFPWFL